MLWSYQIKKAQFSPEYFKSVATQLAYEIEERADRIDGLSMFERNKIIKRIEEEDQAQLSVFE